jgi:hypothetical protein
LASPEANNKEYKLVTKYGSKSKFDAVVWLWHMPNFLDVDHVLQNKRVQ